MLRGVKASEGGGSRDNGDAAQLLACELVCLTLRGILTQRCEEIKTENQMLTQRMLMVKVDL